MKLIERRLGLIDAGQKSPVSAGDNDASKILICAQGMNRSAPHRDGITNRLLLSVAPATLGRLRPQLMRQNVGYGSILDHLNRQVRHMYFVNRGLISLVKTMQDGRTVEIGAVGIEGVTDVNALFGIENAILDAKVQIPGTVFRITREAFSREMSHDDALRALMQR